MCLDRRKGRRRTRGPSYRPPVIWELIISTPCPARYEARNPAATFRRARRTDSRSGCPRARYAAVEAASVQPAPWSAFRYRRPPRRTIRTPSKSTSTRGPLRWPPLTSTAWGPRRRIARAAHADRRERLQVRLNARAAHGVAARDRQGGAHLRGKQDAAFKSDARHVVSVVSGTPLNSARLIGTEVRARSGHIKFDKKVRWKNLVSAFRPLFLKFLEETQQLPEDMESVDVLVEENLRDLRSNRKPEGYNREGVMRMIFPISNEVEFYVYGRGKALEVARVTEALSRVLQKYRLKHTIEWDQLKLLADKKE